MIHKREHALFLRRIRSLRRPDLSAQVAPEQGAASRISRVPAVRARRFTSSSTRSRRYSPPPISRLSLGAVVDARRASGVVWGIGAHVIKTGLGPVLIDLMERGFVSAIATNGAARDSRFRDRARRGDVRGRRSNARAGQVRDGGGDRDGCSTTRSRWESDAGWASGRRSGRFSSDKQPQFARSSVLGGRGHGSVFRSRCTWRSAPTSSTCILRRPGAAIGEGSLRDFRYLRVECRAARAGRVHQLRIGGRSAGGVSEGRGAGAQPGDCAGGSDDRGSRFHHVCTGHRPTSCRVRRRARAAGIRWSAITR